MKKRWLLRLGLFAGLALFGFWFVQWLIAPRYSISQQAFDQIQIGMTEDEVRAIIGIAPGNYSGPAVDREGFLLRERMKGFPFFASGIGCSCKEWFCDRGAIQIAFDKEGKVAFHKDFSRGIAGQFVAFPDGIGNTVRRLAGIRFPR